VASRLTALVVGSISRDLLAGGDSVPGGAVHWAGLALLRLGASVRVLTRAAEVDDSLLDPLRAAGAEVLRLPSAETTTCRNEYGPHGDRHELWACSDPIRAPDVPEAWRGSDLVQLGPLHRDDLAPGIARGLGGAIGLDLQGLVRSGSGVATRLAAPHGLAAQLAGVAVLKAGEAELAFALQRGETPGALLRRCDLRELLITRGSRGALLLTRETRVEVAALPVQPRHLVGAGDVFLAAYLFGRARGEPPLRAARLASRASAAKIESGELPAGFAMEGDGG
jgi:sugar/nucleoside kinase (ribokinase family)